MNVRLIPEFEDGRKAKTEPYRILDALIPKYHGHLQDARIAMCWRLGWSPDTDGRMKLGQCRKASDLDRELKAYDFVILLNQEVWEDEEFTAEKKKHLIDHELCHAQVALDDKGVFKRDERGRIVYRVRGHDVEEFTEIVERHGAFVKRDLERFARAIIEKHTAPLFDDVDDGPIDESPSIPMKERLA